MPPGHAVLPAAFGLVAIYYGVRAVVGCVQLGRRWYGRVADGDAGNLPRATGSHMLWGHVAAVFAPSLQRFAPTVGTAGGTSVGDLAVQCYSHWRKRLLRAAAVAVILSQTVGCLSALHDDAGGCPGEAGAMPTTVAPQVLCGVLSVAAVAAATAGAAVDCSAMLSRGLVPLLLLCLVLLCLSAVFSASTAVARRDTPFTRCSNRLPAADQAACCSADGAAEWGNSTWLAHELRAPDPSTAELMALAAVTAWPAFVGAAHGALGGAQFVKTSAPMNPLFGAACVAGAAAAILTIAPGAVLAAAVGVSDAVKRVRAALFLFTVSPLCWMLLMRRLVHPDNAPAAHRVMLLGDALRCLAMAAAAVVAASVREGGPVTVPHVVSGVLNLCAAHQVARLLTTDFLIGVAASLQTGPADEASRALAVVHRLDRAARQLGKYQAVGDPHDESREVDTATAGDQSTQPPEELSVVLPRLSGDSDGVAEGRRRYLDEEEEEDKAQVGRRVVVLASGVRGTVMGAQCERVIVSCDDGYRRPYHPSAIRLLRADEGEVWGEMRMDETADGHACFTKSEFVAHYGGTAEWDASLPMTSHLPRHRPTPSGSPPPPPTAIPETAAAATAVRPSTPTLPKGPAPGRERPDTPPVGPAQEQPIVAPPPQTKGRRTRRNSGKGQRSQSRDLFEALFHSVATDGAITMADLERTMGSVDMSRCAGVMATADQNRDGVVDLQEWIVFVNLGVTGRGFTVDTTPLEYVQHFAAQFGFADFSPQQPDAPQPKPKKKRRPKKAASQAGTLSEVHTQADGDEEAGSGL